MLPSCFFGRSRHQTTSNGLGISIFNLVMKYLSDFAVIAAPPPRLLPGLAVEKYNIPFISSISSNFFFCLGFSFFSHTSANIEKSVALSVISSARLEILDQTDLILYTEKVGRDRASRNLLSLLMVMMFFGTLVLCLSGFRLEGVGGGR